MKPLFNLPKVDLYNLEERRGRGDMIKTSKYVVTE